MPAAPEPLRLFDQIGFGMTRFLSASDDYADPMVVVVSSDRPERREGIRMADAG